MSLLQLYRVAVGEVGVKPGTIKMVSTANLATVTAAGYLNGVGGQLNTLDIAPSDIIQCFYSYNVSSDSGTFTFLKVAISNGVITLSATSGDDALSNGKIFIGNAANVSTEQTMSGDATLASSGVLTIANSAITNAKVAAAAAIDFSKLAALSSGNILVGSAGNVATSVVMSGDATIVASGALTIANSAITNAKVAAAAAIDFSKLASLSSANILVGSAGNVATAVAVTGDVTISNTGVTAIAADSIVNADINTAAAIAFSKFEALTSGNILVGSAGNVATSVAMSGDATIIASGALTIANDAITTAKILNANVTLAKLAAGITPSHVIKYAGQLTTVGGAAAEAFTVTGAVGATDRAFVQIVNDGTANVTVLQAVVTDNTLTVTFSLNPGNDCVFNYQIIRAAA